ncbi:MAG: hypothetical protein U0R70_04310 [Solirubrobacteraceae bacterium]
MRHIARPRGLRRVRLARGLLAVAAGAAALALVPAAASALPVGPLDPSWGRHGTLETATDGDLASIAGAWLLPGGASVVLGLGIVEGGTPSLDLRRYGATGRRTAGFPAAGFADLGGSYAPSAALRSPDGRILSAGGFVDGATGESTFAVVRHTASGARDLAFGMGGARAVPALAGIAATAVAADGTGRIVAAGPAANSASGTRVPARIGVARLDATGTPDPAFGTGGAATVALPGLEAVGYSQADAGWLFPATIAAVVPRSGGGALVAGSAISAGLNRSVAFVAALRSDGSLDPSFGSGGVATFTPLGTLDTTVGAATASGGRIVLAVTQWRRLAPRRIGDTSRGWWARESATGVVRLRLTGAVDRAFGTGGYSRIPFPQPAHASALHVLRDGRLLLGAGAPYQDVRFLFARLRSTGAYDGTFGGGRACVVTPSGGPQALATDAGGGGLAAAGAGPGDAGIFFFARLRARFAAPAVACPAASTDLAENRAGPIGRTTVRFLAARRVRVGIAVWTSNGAGQPQRVGEASLGWQRAGLRTAAWNGRIAGASVDLGPTGLAWFQLVARDARGRRLGASPRTLIARDRLYR